MKDAVRVNLTGLGGQTLEFSMDKTDSIRALKTRLAKKLQVPPSCQNLVCGGVLVDDALCVGTIRTGTGCVALHLTMLLSLEAVRREVVKGGAKSKLRALSDLDFFGQRGGNASISAICACLRSSVAPAVVKSAISTLGMVAERGSKHAINEIAALVVAPRVYTTLR